MARVRDASPQGRLRSGSEIKIPLRLQLRDPDHAALIGADKTRQQVFQRNILRFHGVAACSEFKAGPGKLAEAPGRIGIGRCRMKCPQRLAMHHKCDRDVVGTADTVEMATPARLATSLIVATKIPPKNATFM